MPNSIVDGTAHVGGDTIALALYFTNAQVFAVKMDYVTADALEHNIAQYNLTNVVVLRDDCTLALKHIDPIDVLYIDAPWGADYKYHESISLMLSGRSIGEVVKRYVNIGLFIFKVPLNFNTDALLSEIAPNCIQQHDYIVHGKKKFRFLSIRS